MDSDCGGRSIGLGIWCKQAMKVCSKCKADKQLSEFYKHYGKVKSYCKKCAGRMTNEWRAKREKQNVKDYAKEIKIAANSDAAFFENTYAKMLADRGIKIKEYPDGFKTYRLPTKYHRKFKQFSI